MARKKTFPFLIIFFTLSILSLRMIHPSADPPATLSMSGGAYGDPGGYTYNARNKIVFGQWKLDMLNAMYLSPIPHLVTYLSFKIFGVGFTQMNLVPIFFSCLVLIFVALSLKNRLNNSIALIGLFLLGINYLFIMYSRIANRIMPMLFFLVLALLFFQKGIKNKKWYSLAGFFCLLSFITKGVNFYVEIAFVIGFLTYLAINFRLKESLLSFGYFILGFLTPLIIWLVFIYFPHRDIILTSSRMNIQFLVPPKSIPLMLEYFWTRPSILLKNMPIVYFLSCFYFLILLFRLTHNPKKIHLLHWIMIFWYAGGFFYFAIIYQRVTRHFIPQILPMVFLSAYAIHDFLTSGSITKPRKIKTLFGFALFFWLLFPVSKLLKLALAQLPSSISDIWIATSLLVILSSLLALFIFQMIKFWPEKFKLSLSPSFKKTAVLVILLAVLIINGHKYISWAIHPQFKMKQVSIDLGKAFDQAAIAGLWAPVICLENKHRAHEFFPGYINDEKDFLERYNITHVFATTIFGENRDYWRYFPEMMGRAKLMAKYFIWRTSVLLYELHPSPEDSRENDIYEAEIYTQPLSMPRFDPEASGKFSVRGEKNKPNFIAIVTSKKKISPGKYKILFRMRKEGISLKSTSRIARIDAVSKSRQRVLALKNLFNQDFVRDKEYQEFSLFIHLKKALKLDFRVYSDGLVNLWVDKIKIMKN